MYINKVTKNDDHSLRLKSISCAVKTDYKKWPYLPRINLRELVHETKQRLSMQGEPFYNFTFTHF